MIQFVVMRWFINFFVILVLLNNVDKILVINMGKSQRSEDLHHRDLQLVAHFLRCLPHIIVTHKNILHPYISPQDVRTPTMLLAILTNMF